MGMWHQSLFDDVALCLVLGVVLGWVIRLCKYLYWKLPKKYTRGWYRFLKDWLARLLLPVHFAVAIFWLMVYSRYGAGFSEKYLNKLERYWEILLTRLQARKAKKPGLLSRWLLWWGDRDFRFFDWHYRRRLDEYRNPRQPQLTEGFILRCIRRLLKPDPEKWKKLITTLRKFSWKWEGIIRSAGLIKGLGIIVRTIYKELSDFFKHMK